MKNANKILLIGLTAIALMGCQTQETSSQSSQSQSQSVEQYDVKYVEYEDELTGDFYRGFVNEENLPHGFGTMFYGNGDMYEGNFENGIKQGTGTMTYSTACVYIGEWNNDLMEGSGYMIWPMGDYFYGEWKYGNPFYGTKYFLQPNAPIDGSIESRYCIYHGQFDGNGLMNGYGSMSWPSGDYYIGHWENNVRHGHGTQYWPSEDPNIPQMMFVGEFSKDHDGWIFGEGTMYYRDGRIETGIWNGTEKVG